VQLKGKRPLEASLRKSLFGIKIANDCGVNVGERGRGLKIIVPYWVVRQGVLYVGVWEREEYRPCHN